MSDDDLPEPDRLPGAPHPRAAARLFGHEVAESAFLEAFASGRLHHAWLIAGPEGVGKATLAWRIARFLLARPAEEPAGLFGGPALPTTLDVAPEHPVARRVAALSEPRLFLLRRPLDEKTRKLKTEITVDATRKLKSFFALSSSEAGRRVVIVDAADEMNRSAANALLKLLEEPPPNATLLLVSHSPSRLLPTIRSRCRILRLRPLAASPLAEALHQTGADPVEGPTAPGLAALSDGSVGAAFQLVESDGLAFYGELVRLFSAAPGIDRPSAIALAQWPGAERFPLALHLIEMFLARLARAGAAGPPEPEAVPGEAAALARLSPGPAAARRWAQVAQEAGDRARHGHAVNLDPAALLLDMVLRMDGAAGQPAPA
jgi:DNA polymerase-3 subunit delta'